MIQFPVFFLVRILFLDPTDGRLRRRTGQKLGKKRAFGGAGPPDPIRWIRSAPGAPMGRP